MCLVVDKVKFGLTDADGHTVFSGILESEIEQRHPFC